MELNSTNQTVEFTSAICLKPAAKATENAEAAAFDRLFPTLVKQGQSIQHICVSNASDIIQSEKDGSRTLSRDRYSHDPINNQITKKDIHIISTLIYSCRD